MKTHKTPVTDRYKGRTVAITGAAQGLGLAMASRFAAEGASLALADVNDVLLSEAMNQIQVHGDATVSQNVVDVTDSSTVNGWILEVEQTQGAVDVLVNNAGIIRDNRIEKISDADWDAVVDVSLKGAFYCSRAVFPGMRKRRYGRIISFSSMSWRGNFGQSNYVAAKAGVVGLTRTLALEGARDGITANAIAPGLIETPMLASMNDAARNLLINKVPMMHTGDPSDIAEAAAFLGSEGAAFITGVVLDVDGGISIGSSIR
ncbi:SDR family NAD(P)-dependent oxidoreductase [Micrococcaceae bacterium Sec5.1]